MDNVKQWTGLSLPVLLHTAQDRNTEGERRKGRQKNQWMDNIKQWTGLSLSVLLNTAQFKTGTLKVKDEEDARRRSSG